MSTRPDPIIDLGHIKAQQADSVAPQSAKEIRFADLGLPNDVVQALSGYGLEIPFPIQAATIPDVLAGRDILGRGRTGSGKTLAFGLSMMSRLTGQIAGPCRPLGLVLVPTRELATQVRQALLPYAKVLGLRIDTVLGGTSIQRQIDALRSGVEIIVATPGRLTDLIDRKACLLSDTRICVLDEADQMADMGFLPAVSALLDQISHSAQRMLFSATLDRDVDKLVRQYLVDPVSHCVDPPAATISTMIHRTLHVAALDKHSITTEIAARDGRTILFVRTKVAADRLAHKLVEVGIRAAAMHGGKTQAVRTRTLGRFRNGTLNVLVATDVAARGIHVDGIDLVVNVDLPGEAKDYVHRSGRTARAGKSGTVVTLVLPAQRRQARRMLTAVGIVPETLAVRPGDASLVLATGARPLTSLPTVEETPARDSGCDRPRARKHAGRHNLRSSTKARFPRTGKRRSRVA